MKVEIQVSERWIEGFTKAAAEMGLDEAQIPALLKAANLKMARDADPVKFDEGVESVMGEKSAAFWPALILGGGLTSAGALGMHGLKKMFGAVGQTRHTERMLRDVASYNAERARLAAQHNLLGSAVGQPKGYGYGMGGFGPYGHPF